MKKKKCPERPIDVSKLIDKHIERGELPLSFRGEYLPDSSGQLGLGLREIAPKDQKKKTEKDEND